jgi:hypothetical protein
MNRRKNRNGALGYLPELPEEWRPEQLSWSQEEKLKLVKASIVTVIAALAVAVLWFTLYVGPHERAMEKAYDNAHVYHRVHGMH